MHYVGRSTPECLGCQAYRLEGGAELDEYAKVALLSMMAWHVYTDAVRRRREGLNRGGFTN